MVTRAARAPDDGAHETVNDWQMYSGAPYDRVPQLAELLLCMVAAVIQVNELAARERNALELSPLRGSGPHVRFPNAESDTAPRVQPVALAGG